jgi:opacity protein-like surface antigen
LNIIKEGIPMAFKKFFITFIFLFSVSLTMCSTLAAEVNNTVRDCVQISFGVTKLDRDDSTISATSDDETTTVQSAIDSLPTIGIMGQMSLWGESLQAGIEGGLDGSWRNDSSRVTTSNGTRIVYVDNQAYLINLYYGLYGSWEINHKARVYLGAGGMLNWARVEVKNESDSISDQSESAFGFGPYVRSGIEFKLDSGYLLGVGVRSLTSDLDFSDSVGEIAVDGVQLMLTFALPVSKGIL